MPIVILVMLMVLIIAAVPVGAVLGILSLSLDELFMRGRRSMMLGDFVWEQSIEYILVAIPRLKSAAIMSPCSSALWPPAARLGF